MVSWAHGTVVGTGPVTVFYDGETSADAVPVNHLAPGIVSVSADDRVTVHFYDGLAVIAMVW